MPKTKSVKEFSIEDAGTSIEQSKANAALLKTMNRMAALNVSIHLGKKGKKQIEEKLAETKVGKERLRIIAKLASDRKELKRLTDKLGDKAEAYLDLGLDVDTDMIRKLTQGE
jgi:hypothetical protein